VTARRSQPRSPRDPYGIGPVAGYIGPALAAIALVLVGVVSLNLINFQLPFRSTSNPNGGPGPEITPAPSNQVITPPEAVFAGTIVYAKAGNIWIQTDKDGARQVTSGGTDSMPSVSADGSWIYFIRQTITKAIFPTGGRGVRTWYDLATPTLMRVKLDGSATPTPEPLLVGQYKSGRSTWFYWIRQPVVAANGRTVALISDGPNPTANDVVLQLYDIQTKKLTKLKVPETAPLGHQDPTWRADGKVLLFVKNGRELLRGAPQIWRYDVASAKSAAVTGPGYLSPSYSPDGGYLAATRTDTFGQDIVILDGAGKELLRLTDDGHSFSPVWSPAGDAIAYLHLQGTLIDLRMIQLAGTPGNWTAAKTVDLTKVSGLDGSSRPEWFIPPSELPASSGSPTGSSGPAGSAGTGSTAP
jgi:Tol biopolymer transport system component